MTSIDTNGPTIRYSLTAPWFIGSNLRPTVRDGGTEISIWVDTLRNHEGRVGYGYEIRQDGATIVTGTDISSGCWSEPDLDDTLRSLLGFADAYSESVQPGGWSAEYGVFDGRVLDDRDLALAEWAYAHLEDLPYEWQCDPADME